MLPLAEDGDLLHHWELDIVLFHKVEDPLGVMRFLRTKLIAREGQDFETLVLIILVHLDQLSVVPLGYTSFRCDINDKDGLLPIDKVSESLDLSSIQFCRREFKERRLTWTTITTLCSKHRDTTCSSCFKGFAVKTV